MYSLHFICCLFLVGLVSLNNCDSVEISQQNLQRILTELESLQKKVENLEKLSQKKEISQVPIGFIYFQLPYQSPPNEIWPTETWTEVTPEYAGLFFRAQGGHSDKFGVTQEDSTRQITQIEETYNGINVGFPNPMTLPLTGWSDYGHVGHYPATSDYSEGLRFHTSDNEVRPRNTAIKIWKRSA